MRAINKSPFHPLHNAYQIKSNNLFPQSMIHISLLIDKINLEIHNDKNVSYTKIIQKFSMARISLFYNKENKNWLYIYKVICDLFRPIHI
jgi:hypothetical protein